MGHYEKDTKLKLLIDIDDVLAYSSGKIQGYVENDQEFKFKSETLKMLEQLCRNCSYLTSEVEQECLVAKIENRQPYLERFIVFDNYKLNNMNKEEWYTKPIEDCKRYQSIAKSFLDQFLEERDTGLEIDNLPKGSIIPFNYRKEKAHLLHLSNQIKKYLPVFHKINVYCLGEVNRIINEAKSKNNGNGLIIPSYGKLVSMDTNDIIKKGNSKDIVIDKEKIVYDNPYKQVHQTLNLEGKLFDLVSNGKVYFTRSREMVDYDNIYVPENVNWEAVSFFQDLINSDIFDEWWTLSHYNGGREGSPKKRLTQELFPKAKGCILVRFHNKEHDVVRRDRSNKFNAWVEKTNTDPMYGILGDDSVANCRHCKESGGTELLCKPMTDSEIINGKMEDTGFNRIIDYKQNNAYQYIAEAYVKTLTKK